jgi:hypothetical protein
MWGLWGNVGICGEMWGFVGKCGVCGETYALRILGSYGKNEKRKKSFGRYARLLSIRKVGICVKMSVCCCSRFVGGSGKRQGGSAMLLVESRAQVVEEERGLPMKSLVTVSYL